MAPPFGASRPISGHDLLHPTSEQLAALTRGLAEHRFYVLNHPQIRLHFSERMVQEMLAEPNPVRGIEGLLRAAMDEGRWNLRVACARVIEGYGPLKEEIRRYTAAVPHRLDITTEDKLRSELRPVEERYRDAKCMPGTREGLLSTLLEETAFALEGPNKLVWIHGVAGSGKTSIMGSLAPRLRDDARFSAVSLFICARDVEARRSVHRILPNIAWNLAYSVEGFGRYLAAHIAGGNHVQSLQLQLEGLILAPWRHSGSPAAVILIDALDECDDVQEVRALLDAISFSIEARERVAFVLTSRHVPPVSDHLGQSPSYFTCNISSGELRRSLDSDIEVYMRASYPPMLHMEICRSEDKLATFEGNYELAIARIRDQSNGIFMCASVIRSALQADSTRADLLLNIMQQRAMFGSTDDDILYRMYKTALSVAFRRRYRRPSALEKAVELARRVLGIILCASDPLRVEAIARFAGPGRSKGEVVEVLHLCRPLISWHEQDAPVAFMHASVADFLLSDESGPNAHASGLDFRLDSSENHLYVAQRCLAVLREDLHFNMYDLRDPGDQPAKALSSSLLYASESWVYHLPNPCPPDGLELRDDVVQLLRTRFLFWLEVLAGYSEVASRGIPMMQQLLDCFRFERDVFVTDCDAFVRHLHAYMFNGPASVYLCALPFAPATSTILQHLDVDPAFSWLHATRPVMVIGQPAVWQAEHIRWTIEARVDSIAVAGVDDLLAGFSDGSVALIACATGTEKWRIHFENQSDVMVACTGAPPNFARFAVASGQSGRVHLGDVNCGKIIAKFSWPGDWDGMDARLASVYYSPDGARLALCSVSGKVAMWDLALLKPEITESTTPQKSVAFRAWITSFPRQIRDDIRRGAVSDNGRHLAIAVGSSIVPHGFGIGLEVRELATTRLVLSRWWKRQDEKLLAVAFSADGQWVLVALSNMRVLKAEVYPTTPEILDASPNMENGSAIAASFTNDGATVCFVLANGREVIVRDIVSGYQCTLKGAPYQRHNGPSVLSCSSDSKHFVVDHHVDPTTLTVWDLPTPRQQTFLTKANPDMRPILAFALSSDERWLTIAREYHEESQTDRIAIELWDLQQLQAVWSTTPDISSFASLTFSPSESLLVVTSERYLEVLLIDSTSGDVAFTWRRTSAENFSSITALRFSRSSDRVAWWYPAVYTHPGNSGTEVCLLDLLSASRHLTTWRMDLTIRELAFSIDGNALAVWGDLSDHPPLSRRLDDLPDDWPRATSVQPLFRSAKNGLKLSVEDVDPNVDFCGLFGSRVHVLARLVDGTMEVTNAASSLGKTPDALQRLKFRSRTDPDSLVAQTWLTRFLARISALEEEREVSILTETNTIYFYRRFEEICMIRFPSPDPWKTMNDAYNQQGEWAGTSKLLPQKQAPGVSSSSTARGHDDSVFADTANPVSSHTQIHFPGDSPRGLADSRPRMPQRGDPRARLHSLANTLSQHRNELLKDEGIIQQLPVDYRLQLEYGRDVGDITRILTRAQLVDPLRKAIAHFIRSRPSLLHCLDSDDTRMIQREDDEEASTVSEAQDAASDTTSEGDGCATYLDCLVRVVREKYPEASLIRGDDSTISKILEASGMTFKDMHQFEDFLRDRPDLYTVESYNDEGDAGNTPTLRVGFANAMQSPAPGYHLLDVPERSTGSGTAAARMRAAFSRPMSLVRTIRDLAAQQRASGSIPAAPPTDYRFPDAHAIQRVVIAHFPELIGDSAIMNQLAEGLRIRLVNTPEQSRPEAAENLIAASHSRPRLRQEIWQFLLQ